MEDNCNFLKLRDHFHSLGMEIKPFKIGWYNHTVSSVFKLPYDYDTTAFVVMSTPSMFEKAFIPFVKKSMKQDWNNNGFRGKDPLDSCLINCFQKAQDLFPDENCKFMQDFEILPNKRPKILVQTAAHVAGAAYYYQKEDAENLHVMTCPCAENGMNEKDQELKNGSFTKIPSEEDKNCFETRSHGDGDITNKNNINSSLPEDKTCTCEKPWNDAQRIYGVCVHPDFGGWFAIRGVIIFPNLKLPLLHCPPVDCVSTRQLRIELMNRFNGNWQDWTYRDVIPVKEKYSEIQKKYFATLPKHRTELLHELINI